MPSALLIVDAQANMFETNPVADATGLLGRLESLISGARAAEVPVVFIRNNGGAGDPDESETAGWGIHPDLDPAESELVVDKWQSDSFSADALRYFVKEFEIDSVVVAGVQSEFSIQATARGAAQRGLDVVVVSDAHSTYNGAESADEIIESVNAQLGSTVRLFTTDEVASAWQES
ncbi:MAG: isochorismatase family protein [Actinomycetota bacterium]|nr:isochorismatase family protein [Actinomycetota bacterium]